MVRRRPPFLWGGRHCRLSAPLLHAQAHLVPRLLKTREPKPTDERLRLAIDAAEGLLQRLHVVHCHYLRLSGAKSLLHASDLPKDFIETGEKARCG